MNPKGRHLISAGVLFSALAFSGATFAQSNSTSSPTRSPSASSSNTATPSGSAMSGSSQASPRSDRTQANASTNDNARIENANGDNIGEIKDMMVDTRNERVRYVVLSHGGVLGIGDKLFAYPMSMVETSGRNSDKLVMNVNKEQLDKAPGFDKNKWPDFASNGKYSSEVDKYYGAGSRHDGEQAGPLVRASDLIGKNFDDAKGKDAGEIEDLIVDSNSGNVEYAIVDFDDSWAKQTDGKLVAIPLSSITVGGEKHDKLVIQTSPDRIDMSHAFASNHWPDFSDPAWAQQSGSAAAQSQGSSTAPTSQSASGSPRS